MTKYRALANSPCPYLFSPLTTGALYLLILLVITTATGCVSTTASKGLTDTRRELSREFIVQKLPISVKLAIDDNTLRHEVSSVPRGAPGRSLTLQVGRQLAKGAENAVQLFFDNDQGDQAGHYDATFAVKLQEFHFDYSYGVGYFPNDKIEYNMDMVVQTTLIDATGRDVYQKELRIQHGGWGEHPAFAGNDGGSATAAEGNAMLVALWLKKLAKDITEDPEVRTYGRRIGREITVAEAAPAPEITLSEPLNNSSTSQPEVTLKGVIRSKSLLTEQHITLNGHPIPQLRGVKFVTDNTSDIIINQKIKLPLGENIITVTAKNQAGGVAQKIIKLSRFEPTLTDEVTAPTTAIGERWAVVVGLSEYKDKGIPSLSNSAEDARSFSQFLKSPNGGSFSENNILLLVNQQATSTALRRALFTYLKKAIEEDLVIFFFSGHGASEPGTADNYYLLTYDADPDDLPATAIPTWDVDMAFKRNIKAKRSIILVDAYRTAAIGNNKGTRALALDNMSNRYLKKLSETGEGRVIFTASQDGQIAVDSRFTKRKTGLFTHYLLEALSGVADENSDGIVSLGETIDYTTDLVEAASRGKQRPDIVGKFDRNLPFAVLE